MMRGAPHQWVVGAQQATSVAVHGRGQTDAIEVVVECTLRIDHLGSYCSSLVVCVLFVSCCCDIIIIGAPHQWVVGAQQATSVAVHGRGQTDAIEVVVECTLRIDHLGSYCS
jgi:hypothetical protein